MYIPATTTVYKSGGKNAFKRADYCQMGMAECIHHFGNMWHIEKMNLGLEQRKVSNLKVMSPL